MAMIRRPPSTLAEMVFPGLTPTEAERTLWPKRGKELPWPIDASAIGYVKATPLPSRMGNVTTNTIREQLVGAPGRASARNPAAYELNYSGQPGGNAFIEYLGGTRRGFRPDLGEEAKGAGLRTGRDWAREVVDYLKKKGFSGIEGEPAVSPRFGTDSRERLFNYLFGGPFTKNVDEGRIVMPFQQ